MDTEIDKNICSICKRKILKHAKKPIATAAIEICIETAQVWPMLILSLRYQTLHGFVESAMMIFFH